MEKILNKQILLEDEICIHDIIIPKEFSGTTVNERKLQKVVKYYINNGYIDKPVTVIPITNEKGLHNKFLLVDEYSRYISAKNWLGLKTIKVKYISIDDYCNIKNM